MRPSARIVLVFQLVDAPFLVVAAIGWVMLLGVDVGAVIVPITILSGIRWLMTGGYLFWLLRPIDGWRSAVMMGQREPLLAAHAALQRAPTNFTIGYCCAWVTALSIATIFIWIAGTPIGGEDIITMILLLSSSVAGTAALAFPVITALIQRERIAISRPIMDCGLPMFERHAALSSRMFAMMVAYVGGSAALIGTVAWATNVWFDRHNTASELATIALQDANRVSDGLTPIHGEVIDTSALPPPPAITTYHNPEFRGLHIVVDRRQAHVYVAAPIHDGHWLLVDGPVSPHRDTSFHLLMLIFGGALLLWGPLTAILNTRALLGPLTHLELSMRRLTDVGDILGQVPLPVIQDDEVGILTRCYNELVGSLRDLAEAARTIASGQLTITIVRPGDLHEAFRVMASQLDSIIAEIHETAVEVSSTTAEMHAAMQEQEAAAMRNATSVMEVRATLESLADSARAITGTANDVRQHAKQTLATTDDVAGKISELSTQANGISELLDVIRDIADRSDLIALNGSLEATRAGEAGRGFALVAAEMRRLAERVTQTVAGGRTRVVNIKSAGTTTVMAMQESRKLALDTTIAAEQIVTVTRQQSDSTTQAVRVTETIADDIVAASIATGQTRAAAETLRARADALDRMTRRFIIRRRA